ncbi:hypothetical protein IC620_11705 [Hazenella sp. IB182357]|uniref:Uncharacterized protein n=1 Tax=Polycladospora coralii TaxID=2771432 RepID=A0A926RTN0_9BACL|nr:hypothetical protein [Polycladospora coralii]MBD1373020.1 hypothetical protein [Polycladospora coralii]MBS7529636.1 hypothetical protein [Polycladospora coralii]
MAASRGISTITTVDIVVPNTDSYLEEFNIVQKVISVTFAVRNLPVSLADDAVNIQAIFNEAVLGAWNNRTLVRRGVVPQTTLRLPPRFIAFTPTYENISRFLFRVFAPITASISPISELEWVRVVGSSEFPNVDLVSAISFSDQNANTKTQSRLVRAKKR